MLREKALEFTLAATENRFVRAATFAGMLLAHTTLATPPTLAQEIRVAQAPEPTPLRIDITVDAFLKKLSFVTGVTGSYLAIVLAPALIMHEQRRRVPNALSKTGLALLGAATASADIWAILYLS